MKSLRGTRAKSKSPAVNKALWQETGGHCVYCDCRSGGKDATQEHLIPKSKGGPDDIINLVPACRGCNRRRSKKGQHKNPLEIVHPRHADYVQNKIGTLLAWLENQLIKS